MRFPQRAAVNPSGLKLASVETRVGAKLVDWVVMFPVANLIVFGLRLVDVRISSAEGLVGQFGGVMLVWAVLTNLYELVMIGSCGDTFGKRLVSVRVVSCDGLGSCGWWRAGARCGIQFVFLILPLIILVCWLWSSQDERRQGWHDKFAGTLVIMHD